MDKPLIKQAAAIPNLFGYLRILLIPEFVWLCLIGERYAALFVLALSAASDMLDGRAARGLEMITPLGKILDPAADKLTQIAVIGCLAAAERRIIFLLVILAAKELSALVCSVVLLRSGGQPFSSLWFGKLSTGALYVYSGLLLGLPHDERAILWMTCAVSSIVLVSFILYTFEFLRKIIGGGAA